MQRIAALRQEIEPWRKLAGRIREALELAELISLEEERDPDLVAEVEAEADLLVQRYEKMEFEIAFSGKHDANDAILTISAGAGGTESQDWGNMLLRMYLRWADQNGYKAELVDRMDGHQAGIKSAAIEISGKYAYGYLKGEKGPHRLVRLSPFDSSHRRHTSFVGIDVMPIMDNTVEVHIDPSEIKMEVYRASGAGGQHIQKNSTAVRLIHKPTGIAVNCQNERSQLQNREMAMKILKSRLYELERRRLEKERAKIAGIHKQAEWGNQIRSYVLHPYQMVKDHRTNAQTSNTQGVLNGKLDLFISSYLNSQVGESS